MTTPRLFVGMFLIAALLCLLRMATGSIFAGAGLLAGCILLRRSFRKLGLWSVGEDQAFGSLAPQGDPRQAGLFWVFLLVGIALVLVRLARHGEAQIKQKSLDVGFKRIMPFSNLTAFAPLDLWLRQLWDARFRVGLRYVPRLVWVLFVSTLNTLLSLPERCLAPLLMRHKVKPPVFIVGVHRSGTSHLHNLLALDPQFCTPRGYQVYNPYGFLTTGWLATICLGPFLTLRRPMDGMAMSAFTPQEEEFALTSMCAVSPYWGWSFPRRIERHDRAILMDKLSERERSTWRRCHETFLRKLTLLTGRRPLLKSPYNVGRVEILSDMYPAARFIHIVRQPHDVYRSNMHLAEHGLSVFQLQDADPADNYKTRFLARYRQLEDVYQQAAERLPAGDTAEVVFENLESDPIAEIRRLYDELGLEYTLLYHQRLEQYLSQVADYKKNRFQSLPEPTREAIDAALAPHLQRWGYVCPPPKRKARAA